MCSVMQVNTPDFFQAILSYDWMHRDRPRPAIREQFTAKDAIEIIESRAGANWRLVGPYPHFPDGASATPSTASISPPRWNFLAAHERVGELEK